VQTSESTIHCSSSPHIDCGTICFLPKQKLRWPVPQCYNLKKIKKYTPAFRRF
jgi:hypothetical protein